MEKTSPRNAVLASSKFRNFSFYFYSKICGLPFRRQERFERILDQIIAPLSIVRRCVPLLDIVDQPLVVILKHRNFYFLENMTLHIIL